MTKTEALLTQLVEYSKAAKITPEHLAQYLEISLRRALNLWWGNLPLTAEQIGHWCAIVGIDPELLHDLADRMVAISGGVGFDA